MQPIRRNIYGFPLIIAGGKDMNIPWSKRTVNDGIQKLMAENTELRSMCLWSIRRLHPMYKELAYVDYEKITGEKPKRD